MTAQNLYVELGVVGLGTFRSQLTQAGSAVRQVGDSAQQAGQATTQGMNQVTSASQSAARATAQAGAAATQAGRASTQAAGQQASAAQQSAQAAAQQQQAQAAQRRATEETINSSANLAVVMGTVLAAGLLVSADAYMQLEERMLNVATISDTIAGSQEAFAAQVVQLSTELPQSANQLAEGLYDVVSSGFDGAEAMTVLEVSAKAASAGMTDTATSGRVITSVLNAYGMSAAHAEDVSDVLFMTVNKGVVTFEELAMSLGNVIPTAAAAGVPIEEVGAAIAAMTLSGISGNEAVTSLNGALEKILVPGAEMKTALKEIGFESGLAALETLGLKGTIDKLAKSQGTAADTAFRLFPEIRAAKAYLALTAAEGENYAVTFDAIADAQERAEATAKAYEKQSSSTKAQIKLLGNTVKAVAIDVGASIAPAIKAGVDAGRDFVGMFRAMPGPMKDVLGVFSTLVAIGLLGGGLITKAAMAWKVYAANLAATGAAGARAVTMFRVLAVSAGIVGAALIAASFIYGNYADKKQEAVDITNDFTDALRQEADGVKNAALDTLVGKLVENGSFEALKKAGADYSVVIQGVMGSTKDWAAAEAELRDALYPEGIERQEKAVAALEQTQQRGADAANELFEAELAYQDALGTGNEDEAKARLDALTETVAKGEQATNDLTVAYDDLASARAKQAKKLENYEEVTSEVKALRTGLLAAREAFKVTEQAAKDTKKAVASSEDPLTRLYNRFAPLKEGVNQLDDSTKAWAESMDQLTDPINALTAATKDGEVTLDRFVKKLEDQQRDFRDWASNLATLAAQGRVGLANELAAMGPQAAGIAADAVKATAGELDKLEGLLANQGRVDALAFSKGLNLLPVIAAEKGKATVASLSKSLNLSDGEVRVMLRQVLSAIGPNVPIRKDIEFILRNDREVRRKARETEEAIKRLPPGWSVTLKQEGADKVQGDAKRTKGAVEDIPKDWKTLLKQFGADDVIGKSRDVKGAVENVPTSRKVTITAAVDQAISAVSNVIGVLGQVQSKSVTVTVNRQSNARSAGAEENADGGLYVGGIRRFANGGVEDHRAQIAGPGTWRLWAEPETGGEAYIPLASHKRTRSLALTRDVANRFGYQLTPKGGAAGQTVIVQQMLPDKVTLVAGGQSFTAYVRRVAASEAAAEVGGQQAVSESAGRLSWR